MRRRVLSQLCEGESADLLASPDQPLRPTEGMAGSTIFGREIPTIAESGLQFRAKLHCSLKSVHTMGKRSSERFVTRTSLLRTQGRPGHSTNKPQATQLPLPPVLDLTLTPGAQVPCGMGKSGKSRQCLGGEIKPPAHTHQRKRSQVRWCFSLTVPRTRYRR